MLTIETATAPSHWASYFINGDSSGLEPDEKAAADSFIARLGYGMPSDCEDRGFVRVHDAFKECGFASDCQTYSFLVEKES